MQALFAENEEAGNIGLRNFRTLANEGYLLCDGKRVPVTALPLLHAAIANSWGGPPAGLYFNIPDLRGVFLRGIDNDAGRDTDKGSRGSLLDGGSTGNFVGSFQKVIHFINNGSVGSPVPRGDAAAHSGGHGVQRLHGHEDQDTRPQNVYVNYIILASTSPINVDSLAI